jgi:DNA-directed RNA polymerase specialized sigma24 family protein
VNLTAMSEQGTPGSRPELTLLTDPDAGEVWRAVDAGLRRSLRSRRVSRDVVDDVIQETAARALTLGIRYRDAADLLRWCHRVAANLAVDHYRARTRFSVAYPDVAAPTDVPREVELRLAVHQVHRAISLLPQPERERLLQALAPTPRAERDRRGATRLAVRRHRARERLRRLSGAVWAGLVLLWRLSRRVRPAVVSATAAAALLLLCPTFDRGTAVVRMDHFRQLVATRPGAPLSSGQEGRRRSREPRGARLVRSPLAPATEATPVPLPAAVPVRIKHRPQKPGDHLLCATRVPVVGAFCVG